MNTIFYILIFITGVTFGSFYTLAVYRIPKRQDIVYTHSYCPNCNHKLGVLDLIPILSYIFLGGKCRYCKQKIRPRYLIIEILSGIFFVIFAYTINLDVYNLDKIQLLEFIFFILYFTFIVLMAGIDKEYKKIDKAVLMYGIILSIMYIVYLYIIEKSSIYRYAIYLIIFMVLLIIDTIGLKKKANENYTVSILLVLTIMIIFTGEYVTIGTIISTLLAISIYLLNIHLKNKKILKEYNTQIPMGLYLAIFNIIYLILVLINIKVN